MGVRAHAYEIATHSRQVQTAPDARGTSTIPTLHGEAAGTDTPQLARGLTNTSKTRGWIAN